MPCLLCGDTCRCNAEARSAKTRPRFQSHFEPEGEAGLSTPADAVLVDQKTIDTSEQQLAASLEDGSAAPLRARFVVDEPEASDAAAGDAIGKTSDLTSKLVPEEASLGNMQAGCGETLPSWPTRYQRFQETYNRIVLHGDVANSPSLQEVQPDAVAATGEDSQENQAPERNDVRRNDALSRKDSDTDRNFDSWRQEVAARVHRYRSRRRPREPRYPSLRLKFESSEPVRKEKSWTDTAPLTTSPLQTRQALAVEYANATALTQQEPRSAQLAATVFLEGKSGGETARIIQFPWSVALPVRLDELAEPIIDRPRILEAPEFTPSPPALGGILIEPAEEQPAEKRPGFEIPLQSAAMSRRMLAAAVDAVAVLAGIALFGWVFLKVAPSITPMPKVLVLAAVLAFVFWAAYQYLFLVHTGSTPGLKMANLQLSRFDGSLADRRLRRWRVLASVLSALSLGMGFAWCFLDEDALCWHDRITHTYLGPRAG